MRQMPVLLLLNPVSNRRRFGVIDQVAGIARLEIGQAVQPRDLAAPPRDDGGSPSTGTG